MWIVDLLSGTGPHEAVVRQDPEYSKEVEADSEVDRGRSGRG